MQTKLTGRCEVYATDRRKMILAFLKKTQVDNLVIYLPAEPDKAMDRQSLKLLRQLQKPQYQHITKIIVCSNQNEHPVKNYLALGVTAIVADGGTLGVVLGK